MENVLEGKVEPLFIPKSAIKERSVGDLLSEYGIRPTKQRATIAACVFEKNQHLSADAIYEILNIPIARATVYNTLHLFVRHGLLKKVVIDSNQILFDTNTSNHHHVINLDTGEIRDISPVKVDLTRTGTHQDELIEDIEIVIRVRSKTDQ